MHKILLIGCGDIAMRIARLLQGKYHLYGLIRNPEYAARLRSAGIMPIMGDLDHPESLLRLAGMADTVLHLAPPPAIARTPQAYPATTGEKTVLTDSRTRHLLAALSRGKLPKTLVYVSTSGVYGDCKDATVTETRPVSPHNARAKLRIDAEQQLRLWARRNKVSVRILRVPGIYAEDRLPLERLQKGTPALITSEDGYTNHIHADDLARCVVAATLSGKSCRIYHTVDDSRLKMGEYFDAVADSFNLPRPPRITRAEAQQVLSPMLLSFMNESRQLDNQRMKQELKVTLKFPTVADTLKAIRAPAKRTAKGNATSAEPAKSAQQMEMFPPAD